MVYVVGQIEPLDHVSDDLFDLDYDGDSSNNVMEDGNDSVNANSNKSRNSVEMSNSPSLVDNRESSNVIYMYRETEMYQWNESLSSDSDINKKFGVKKIKSPISTNFVYKKCWNKKFIDSSRFNDASYNRNPHTMPMSQEFYTTHFKIKNFVFDLR